MTGKAGTGKTTFLRYIRSNTKKNLVVVAPTAVAAINAGGVTIHSFFQVPFGPILPTPMVSAFSEFSGKSFGAEKSKIIKFLDLLIIDEISMVRADTIDYIDRILRFIKGDSRPFGGVQILMIGDLYQLPPVFQKDWHLLGKFYNGPYFFDSIIFKEFPLLTFELTKVHRQSDPIFIEILNEIRNGDISEDLLQKLNNHYKEKPANQDLENYVTLTTHNPLVKQLNDQRLVELTGEKHTFKAKITGDFPKEAYPTDEELVLKEGAMVMFIKNDSSGKKQFYNGRTATIRSISGDRINLTFLDDGSSFEANQETWENNKYALSESDQKVTQSSIGSFTQFPLRLAWAITIHKSQGLTFDKAIIDVGAAFAHGQTYVALSRCRNLEGLILKEKVALKNIITDSSVTAFMQKAQAETPDQQTLLDSLFALDLETLQQSFDFASTLLAWQHLEALIVQLAPNEPQIVEMLSYIQQLLAQKIFSVAARFIQKELNLKQIVFLEIKPRLEKATGYFLPNLINLNAAITDLHKALNGIPFHTDYFPTLNQLLTQLEVKIEIFKMLPNIKDFKDIQKVMSNKASKFKQIDDWDKTKANTATTIENPDLYANLLEWRKQTATLKKLIDYHIISDQALLDISAKLPKTLTQLSKVKNVGEGKTATYGEDILKLIRKYLGEGELLF